MLLFAIFSAATIWIQTTSNHIITWGVWLVFFIDFIVRLFKSNQRWIFIRKNPFLIIAIIPLDNIFQLARIARVIHLFRLKVITKHFTGPLIKKLKRRRLTFLIPLTFIVVFLSVIPLYYMEPDISSYKDAFLGSLASLVFFGKSELNPTTATGNMIVIILTVFGVILHGVLISFLFAFIMERSLVKNIVNKSFPKNKDM